MGFGFRRWWSRSSYIRKILNSLVGTRFGPFVVEGVDEFFLAEILSSVEPVGSEDAAAVGGVAAEAA